MADTAQTEPEGETPVNPYSLLEAVNRAADTAHMGWLIFLAIMGYLVIAVAGVTHRDLLLETPVTLPLLQVEIQIAEFFQFAPIVLVVFHFGLVSQLTLLARETLEFDHSIRLLETTDRRTHPLRLELNNFFFAQAIAGPHRSRVVSFYLHGMSWLTLVALPVLLLIYIQIVFLPYHDEVITWTHRIALLVDIGMLISIGVFLSRAETSFFSAFFHTMRTHPFGFIVTCMVLACTAVFSLFVATIPGESLDRMAQRALRKPSDGIEQASTFSTGFAIPFLSFGKDGSLLGVFRRNLVVTDTDLVADREQTKGEPSLSLRGRDLRYAKLDRSDLHQADLTGADLRGASLTGTDLRGTWMQCADVNELILRNDRNAAGCTIARNADFSRAQLDNSFLAGIDLRAATLEDATLTGSSLSYSLLVGANFLSARLDRADLTGGVQAQGASFSVASLQGADLTGAQFEGADLSNASAQAAIFNYSKLDFANLDSADLEAASLQHASMVGTELSGVNLEAADLRDGRVWMAVPPAPKPAELADFSKLNVAKITADDVVQMKGMVGNVPSRSIRDRLEKAFAPVFTGTQVEQWADNPDHAVWKRLAYMGTPQDASIYAAGITQHLARIQCRRRWSDGSVATGIARRSMDQRFLGDFVTIYDRLNGEGCPAVKGVPERILQDFSAAVNASLTD